MDDLDALMHHVGRADPADRLPLLVAADWCDEHDEAALAYALRWAAGRGKRPLLNVVRDEDEGDAADWWWHCDDNAYWDRTPERVSVLPDVLFDVMLDVRPEEAYFASVVGAYRALGGALAALREVVSYPEPQQTPEAAR